MNDKQGTNAPNSPEIKTNDPKYQILIKLENIIFNLTKENLDSSIKQTMKLFDLNYPYTFNLIISNLIFYAFFSQSNVNDLYLNYLELIQTQEEELNKNNLKVIEVFINCINKIQSHESYYLIEIMIERNLIDSNITKNIKSKYFAHYKTKKEILRIPFLKHHEELSKNDFELHKQLIKEGHNPNKLPKLIRNDEIEKLQEISSQTNFTFNQTIEPSLYERCDFINQKNVTLIDYAAFFRSVKCFKYLLMNGAKVINAGNYAVAGGNIEIIHLCEQNHSSFKGSLVTAIMFHRNDIFRYIYENKLEEIKNLQRLGNKCIAYYNYEILSFLEGEHMKINSPIICEAIRIGNLYLVKYFLQNNQVPDNILLKLLESKNIELIKYILEQENPQVNYIHLFYLKFVFIYWCFLTNFGNYINYLKKQFFMQSKIVTWK